MSGIFNNYPESRSQSMVNLDVHPLTFAITDEELTVIAGNQVQSAPPTMELARVGDSNNYDNMTPLQFHDVPLLRNTAPSDYNPTTLSITGTQPFNPPDVTTPGHTDPPNQRFGIYCGAWLAFVTTYLAMCGLLVTYIQLKFQSETDSPFRTHLGFIIISIAALFMTLFTSGIVAYTNNDLQSLMKEDFSPVYDVILKSVLYFSTILTPLSFLLLLFIPEGFNWAGYLLICELFIAILAFKFKRLIRLLVANHANNLGVFETV